MDKHDLMKQMEMYFFDGNVKAGLEEYERVLDELARLNKKPLESDEVK